MNTEVETIYGRISGRSHEGIFSYRGIPYGASTGGANRFKAPSAPSPWSGILECDAYGPSCPQMTLEQFTGHALPPEAGQLMGVLAGEAVTSEDCLVANVWTPTLDPSARLPVLVWLHGGGWSTGSASWPLYVFDNLVREGTVMVGVNHRLGILGFLDLSSIDEEYADSGNVGMLDVLAALAWVRDNITGFGGDPSNVTVFGESGGGAKVSTLLGMPPARGLFHRACAMSGSTPWAQTSDEAAAKTERVLADLGLGRDISSLQKLELGHLVEAEVQLRQGRSLLVRGNGVFPTLGPTLPDHPLEAVGQGTALEVPTLLGCTSDEMLAFMMFEPNLWSMTEEEVRSRFAELVDPPEPLIESYRRSHPDESPTSLFIALVTDALMRVPLIRFSEAQVEAGAAPTFQYRFTYGFVDPEGRTRSAHGLDMPYFFANVDKAPMADGPHAPPLVAIASGSFLAFARNGDPNNGTVPEWPPYSLDERSTMRIDVEPELLRDPEGKDREAWSSVRVLGLRG